MLILVFNYRGRVYRLRERLITDISKPAPERNYGKFTCHSPVPHLVLPPLQ